MRPESGARHTGELDSRQPNQRSLGGSRLARLLLPAVGYRTLLEIRVLSQGASWPARAKGIKRARAAASMGGPVMLVALRLIEGGRDEQPRHHS